MAQPVVHKLTEDNLYVVETEHGSIRIVQKDLLGGDATHELFLGDRALLELTSVLRGICNKRA